MHLCPAACPDLAILDLTFPQANRPHSIVTEDAKPIRLARFAELTPCTISPNCVLSLSPKRRFRQHFRIHPMGNRTNRSFNRKRESEAVEWISRSGFNWFVPVKTFKFNCHHRDVSDPADEISFCNKSSLSNYNFCSKSFESFARAICLTCVLVGC